MGQLILNALAALVPIALGVAGWITTQFFARQIVTFFDLRAQAVEALYFYANVSGEFTGDPTHDARYVKAVEEIRRCAARFEALQRNATKPTRLFLKTCGYDIEQVVKNLTGFSNSLRDKHGGKAFHRAAVEKGLKLAPSYTKEELENLRALQAIRDRNVP